MILSRHVSKTLKFLLVIFFVFLFFSRACVFADWEYIPIGEVELRVYVVALDGVGASRVGNVSRVADGACVASDVEVTRAWWPPQWLYKYGEVNVSITVTLVSDWSEYREVVETASNAVVVNCHGEITPIPSGYRRETWTDKIAEAMAFRNVTWVHVGGYPFYYSYLQDSGVEEWSESGFQRLMSHIGKNNATCNPLESQVENQPISITPYAAQILSYNQKWGYLVGEANIVNGGKPIYNPSFRGELVLTIWGCDDGHAPGAIIKFANSSDMYTFGFYVHIGTYQTFTGDNKETDADYWRGFAGTAAAIWCSSFKFAAEDAILKAEQSIAAAENEGRTKGLDEARQLFQRAKTCFQTHHNEILGYHTDTAWGTAILRAMEAETAAANALQPTFLEANRIPLILASMIGVVTVTAILTKWNKKRRQ